MEKIKDLKERRKKKYKQWIETDFKDWQKRMRKFEVDILDLRIKKETLKNQNK